MQKHNLNDFVAAIAQGKGKVAYNLNTGEMYTNFTQRKIDLIFRRPPRNTDVTMIKYNIKDLMRAFPEGLIQDDFFMVYENDRKEAGDWWSIGTINTPKDGN